MLDGKFGVYNRSKCDSTLCTLSVFDGVRVRVRVRAGHGKNLDLVYKYIIKFILHENSFTAVDEFHYFHLSNL